jgi:hypothetical protein
MGTHLTPFAIAMVGIVSLLIINVGFPQPAKLASGPEENTRVTEQYSIVDENSTFYDFGGVSWPATAYFDSQYLSPDHPRGWVTVSITVPFDIFENSSSIDFLTFFSVATGGGVHFYWSVDWRLYNNSFTAASDKLSDSQLVSADTFVNNYKDMRAALDPSNISLCQPGKWYYEATLTIQNATLFSQATTYMNAYNLLLEIDQQTRQTIISDQRPLLSAIISAVILILVPLTYFVPRKTTHTKT